MCGLLYLHIIKHNNTTIMVVLPFEVYWGTWEAEVYNAAVFFFLLFFQADALTQQFGDLQGSHRELKLAAAHIDDALKGRLEVK